MLYARPRAAAAWQAWRADVAARRYRPAAIGVAIALGSIAALAAATWGAVASSLFIGQVLLILALILAGMLAGVALGVLLVSGLFALIQSLWRRLFGLLMAAACVLAIGVFAVNASPSNAFGLNTYNGPIFAITGIIAFVLGLLVTLELLGQAFWQVTTTRTGFRAARGWRPPIHHLITATRRHFGLPGFLAHFGRSRWRLTLLYFLVALFNALIVALAALLLFATAMFSTLVSLPLTIGAMAAIGAAIYGCYRAGAHFVRRAREETTQVYQTVREWDQRAPVVFLRNFNQDDARIAARSIDPFLRVITGVAPAQTLDEILLEHATPYGPVVAIGDPRTNTPPLGAARIFVAGAGTEWQQVVDGLCTASRVVVMCPTSTEGVRWELDLLTRHDLYKRTIYIANPELPESESRALFEAMAPGHEILVPKGKTPIAAFHDDEDGWRVLAARRLSMQTYTVALNMALQHLLGVAGVRPPKKIKPRREKPEKKGTAKARAVAA